MAPKRKGGAQAGGQAKKKAKKQVQEAPRDEDAAFLESLETPKAKRSRDQSGRYSTDETVERGLHKHFPNVTKAQMASSVVHGKGIRAYVTEAILKLPPKGRLGAKFWKDLKTAAAFKDVSDELVVNDETLPVDDQLVAGIKKAEDACANKRSAFMLIGVLKSKREINQRELAGTMAAASNFHKKGLGKAQCDKVWVEIAKMLVRLGVVGTYQKEVDVCEAFIDGALTSDWLRMKKAGVTLRTWLKVNQGVCGIFMPKDDVQAVINAKGDWHATMRPQVQRLTASCKLAAVLFENAEFVISSKNLGALMDTAIKKLDGKALSDAAVQEVQSEIDRLVAEFAKKQLHRNASLKCTVAWQGAQVEVKAVDAATLGEIKLGCYLKARGLVGDSRLQRLPYENWVLAACVDAAQDQLPEPYLDKFNAARETALDIINSSPEQDMESMKEGITDAEDIFADMDASFLVEVNYLECHIEVQHQKYLENEVLDTLPTQTKHTNVAEAAGLIAGIRETDIFKAQTPMQQKWVEAVHDCVSGMETGVTPGIAKTSGDDSFWNKVLDRLQYFCKHTVTEKVNGRDKTKTIIGTPSIAAQFESMKAEMDKPGKVQKTLSDMEPFQLYRWLLTSDQKDELSRWVEKVVEARHGEKGGGAAVTGGAGGAAKAAKVAKLSGGSSSSAAPSKGKGGKKAAEKKVSADASVMSYFGKSKCK